MTGDGVPADFSYDLIRLPNRRYTFHGTLLHADSSTLIIDSRVTPTRPLVLNGREVVGDGYRAVWFLFNGEPWDLGRFYRPDGTFTGYYADVLEPVGWHGDDPSTLETLVDLFLDLWIDRDGSLTVLDVDELEAAVASGAMDRNQSERARSVLSGLLNAARAGDFPPEVVREFAG